MIEETEEDEELPIVPTSEPELTKARTGIRGLDEITFGGIPKGRSTLIVGGPGCGKTLMAIEFLVRGASDYGEPGLFVAFEETPKELGENVQSLGFKLNKLKAEQKLAIDHVYIEKAEIEETGEYNLDGLFVRLNYGIESIGAKRVVLDTIESLFSGLSNEAILRAELRRLFRWLKNKGVTSIITAEKAPSELTRFSLEEYVSDCVILLDHRVLGQVSTRRLRILKYRGSQHGTNEYPFLIDENGISILPITSLRLDYLVSRERLSSGIPKLDMMLEEKGFYRGSSILVSGSAGTGKSTLCACFVNAACQRGERCLYFAFEESPDQIVRNMMSVGLDLEVAIKSGLLQIQATRSTFYGLETHLVRMEKIIDDFKPSVLVVDPISNLLSIADNQDVRSMLTRLIDHLKGKSITTMLTNLDHLNSNLESTVAEISSVMDTWILLRDIELGGERNRGLYILKSRGMAHSNQIREFILTSKGIDLLKVYSGSSGVLTGSARMAQEAHEKASEQLRMDELTKLKGELSRSRELMEAELNAIRIKYQAKEEEIRLAISQEERRDRTLSEDRKAMESMRQGEKKGTLEK